MVTRARSMCSLARTAATAAALTLATATPALAGPFDNSLWLGTDNTDTLSILNTDRAGTVLRQFGPLEVTGIAVDPATNRIYFSRSDGQITVRDLGDPGTVLVTLDTIATFTEDMAFDGASLWRVDNGAGTVDQIDPGNGNIISSFSTGFTPLGIAWDGANLWVSEYDVNGTVRQFTTAGALTGLQFAAPLDGNTAGGLAFDTADQTLWIGAFNQVYHTTTTGALLGSFTTDSRFIDGLEIQAGPPDPCNGGATMITQQPVGQSINTGGTATFTVAASSPAGGGAVAFQWRRNGVNLTDGLTGTGAVVSGSHSPTLTITAAALADCGAAFDAIASSGCGSDRSDPSGLCVMPSCAVDFNHDGRVNVQDFLAFLAAYAAGC
jgi:hypothetical protein